VLGLVVVLVVLALIFGERIARSYAEKYIHDQLVTVLSLDADHPMRIELGPGSIVGQAIAGSLDSVDIEIDDVPLGDLAGDVRIAATAVPLDAAKPLGTLRIAASVDEENVQKLRSFITAIDVDSITLEGSDVRVSTTFTRLGFDLPVSATVEPSAVDGQLVFDPQTVKVAGVEVPLGGDGVFGSLVAGLVPSQSFCIAQYLPRGIVLTDAAVSDGMLALDLAADGVALGGTEMSTMGTCPTD
jgi:hypothetical protein